MKLVKSLALGGTAVLTVVAGAQAADLPSKKAAPVQYVRVCDAYGAGFFYIPGTDTCLRIGGYVRAEYDYQPGYAIRSASTGLITQVPGDQDQTGMEMRGRVDLDARTQTNWGTVQTVVNLRAANADGLRTSVATTNFQTGYVTAGNASSVLTMERGYIRFAGFTAGVGSENFSTMPSYMYGSNTYAGFPNGIKQLAYTATFGGGFSATLAIESRGDFGYDKPGAGTPVGPSSVVTSTTSTYVNQPDTGYNLVGNIRDDQSWGWVQVSGAVGNDTAEYNGTTYSASNNLLLGPTKYGSYAVGFAFRYNLNFIAPGDQFNFQAAYTKGMLGLILSTGGLSDLSDSSTKRGMGGVIRADSNLVPTFANSSGGVLGYGESTGFSIYGLFTHYWAPDWRTNVAVGYAQITPPTANCSTLVAGVCTQNGGLNTQWGQGGIFMTSANLIWSPAKNFDIGVELNYLHDNSKLQNASTAFIAAGEPGLKNDSFGTHIRLERQF